MWIDEQTDWYVHGDYVLDRISGTRRAELLSIACPRSVVSPTMVRGALQTVPKLLIEINDRGHEIVFSMDTFVMTPDGEVRDVYTGDKVSPTWPLAVETVVPELSNAHIIRLASSMANYPELAVEDSLVRRVFADMQYLLGIRRRFADVELLLEASRPVQKWREGLILNV